MIIENKVSQLFDIQLVFLFIIIFIFSIDLAYNLKLGWDVQNFWISKTLNFLDGGDIYNFTNISNHREDYPHLGSFIWAIYAKISFLKLEYLGRFFYIFLFCLSIFSVSELLKSTNMVKVLFSSVIIILIYNVLLFNGYQEILIFSIFTLFSKYFYLLIKGDISKKVEHFYYVIILLMFLSAIWIKNEAMFFAFVAIFLLLCLPKKNLPLKFSILFSFLFIIFLRFFIFEKIGLDVSTIHAGNYENLNLLKLGSYLSFEKIFFILKYFLFGLLANPLYIISIFLMIFMLYYKKNQFELFYYLASLILNFLLILSFYTFSTTPIEWTLKITIERVLFEVMGIYLIPIIIFLNVYSKKILKT